MHVTSADPNTEHMSVPCLCVPLMSDGLEELAHGCEKEVAVKRAKHCKSTRSWKHKAESQPRQVLLRLRAEQHLVRRRRSRLSTMGRNWLCNDKSEALNRTECGVNPLRGSAWLAGRTNILRAGLPSMKIHFSYDGQTFSGHCPFCGLPLQGEHWRCVCSINARGTVASKAEKHDRLIPSATLNTQCLGECHAVVDYFLYTLGRNHVRVLQIERLENRSSRALFRSTSQQIMFHGCRTLRNEEEILRNGFQVSKAISYPKGTWLASNASYSDGGFVLHENGIKHLFLCLVSDADIVLDHPEYIRVVGQDCAFPVWLVKYTECEGMPIHSDEVYDDAWNAWDPWYGFCYSLIEDYAETIYEPLALKYQHKDKRDVLQAKFDDVMDDAGRHRKWRPRGSDVMRGSGHSFQLRHYRTLSHKAASRPNSQTKMHDHAAHMQRKMRSCARRKAAVIKMQYSMNAI